MLRQLTRDLEFVSTLKFSHFWGVLSKVGEVSQFLDDFLKNVRKYNDIYKLQFMDLYSNDSSFRSSKPASSVHAEIKQVMNKLLRLVLKVFYRMSVVRESDENFMSLSFYQKIVYDSWLIDMAKLLDLASVFGKSNPSIVQAIIDNLFEADKRFVQDFKESVDLMVTQVKKTFKEYATIQAMIKGEHIKEMSKIELQQTILDFLTDYTELLSTFNLLTSTFPSQVLDSLRGTNSLIYLANAYCLTLQMKRDLQEKLKIFIPVIKKDNSTDASLRKLQGYAFAAEI